MTKEEVLDILENVSHNLTPFENVGIDVSNILEYIREIKKCLPSDISEKTVTFEFQKIKDDLNKLKNIIKENNRSGIFKEGENLVAVIPTNPAENSIRPIYDSIGYSLKKILNELEIDCSFELFDKKIEDTLKKVYEEFTSTIDFFNEHMNKIENEKSNFDRETEQINKETTDTYKEILIIKTRLKEEINKLDPDIAAYDRAALASEFSKRREELEGSKKWYFRGFIGGLVLIIGLGISLLYVLNNASADTQGMLMQLVSKLFLIGPIVWLTWFLAKQYTNTNRLAEDYVFKATTALAYKGYEEKAEALDEDMKKELLRTAIRTFGDNPTRLLSKNECASPLNEAIQIAELIGKNSQK